MAHLYYLLWLFVIFCTVLTVCLSVAIVTFTVFYVFSHFEKIFDLWLDIKSAWLYKRELVEILPPEPGDEDSEQSFNGDNLYSTNGRNKAANRLEAKT